MTQYHTRVWLWQLLRCLAACPLRQVDLENNRRIMSSTAGHEAQARGILVAGESGIFTPEHLTFVQETGCQAVLVGESLVKEEDPAAATRALLS